MERQLSRLFELLGLGELLADPVPVQGGFLHRMYRVETSTGCYAVKALNPDIMMRPQALGNMRSGEAAAQGVQQLHPAFDVCAALNPQVTQVDERFYLVYPWVTGQSVYPPHITAEHCRIMGNVLGTIHAANVQAAGMEPQRTVRESYDWTLLKEAETVFAWDAQALNAQKKLMTNQVVSHRDLDPKNVLWQGMRPCVIDWEAAGYVNPWQELVELLNYWADDEPKARALVAAYGEHVDLSAAPWEEALAAGMDGMLGWLHYNLRRSMGLEGSAPDDRTQGAQHVQNTLNELRQYAARAEKLRQWIKM